MMSRAEINKADTRRLKRYEREQQARPPNKHWLAMSIEAARLWMNAPDGVVVMRPEVLRA